MTRSPGEDKQPGSPEESVTAVSLWEEALRGAVDWSILLDDDPEDTKQQGQFREWLAASPMHRKAWEEASRVSGLIVQTKGITRFPVAPAVKAKPAWLPGRRTFAAMAASLAIGWLAAPELLVRASADHRTGTAEQQLVTLNDGSHVRLAPASAIQVQFAGNQRTVTLLTGEAFFDVTPDPARPFQVKADVATVTVLGTGFDVRLGGTDGTEVAVHHGTVQVAAGDETARAILTAGQWARMAPDGRTEQGQTSPDMVGTWSDKRLTAVDRPLSQVVADLRRYYDGQVLLTDAGLGERSVTGIFDMTDPLAAARLIVQPHGGVVRQITPWLMIVSSS